jgi:hypothetical protein
MSLGVGCDTDCGYRRYVTTFRETSFGQIQALRESIGTDAARADNLQQAAQGFVETFTRTFETCALARVFALVHLGKLPESEQAWSKQFAESIGRAEAIGPRTSVLTLLGSAGSSPAWNDRRGSLGHRAIPLLDRAFVDSAPMISGLLQSMKIIPEQGASAGELQIRAMPGGINARFFVANALTSTDGAGRHIIAARDFVTTHGIKSVFGMGGSYVNGTQVIAILFTTEALTTLDVDRYTTFISTFKMATSEPAQRGQLFPRE